MTHSRLAIATLLFAPLALLAAAAASEAPAEAASNYLKFSSRLDGKCQILSDGGKLRVMENTHPSRAIRFRLIRIFADKPQPGRAMGTIAPGDEPRALGCTLVNGWEQRWEVQVAEFAD